MELFSVLKMVLNIFNEISFNHFLAFIIQYQIIIIYHLQQRELFSFFLLFRLLLPMTFAIKKYCTKLMHTFCFIFYLLLQ